MPKISRRRFVQTAVYLRCRNRMGVSVGKLSRIDWKERQKGECPRLKTQIIEGDPRFSIG